MASLYITVGKPEPATRQIGCADAMREKIDDPRPIIEQADVDQISTAYLVKMGEVAYSEAYDEGQKMSLHEGVVYALKED